MSIIRACVRVRPLNEEDEGEESDALVVASDVETRVGAITVSGEKFELSGVFDEDDTNEELFEQVGVPLVHAVFGGAHATLLVYGQTGAGKSFTFGEVANVGRRQEGVAHRCIRACFDDPPDELKLRTMPSSAPWRVECFQLYCERVHDLLADPTEESAAARVRPLRLREDKTGGVEAVGATSIACDSAEEVFELLERAALNLRFAAKHLERPMVTRASVVCRVYVEMVPCAPDSEDSEDDKDDEDGDDDGSATSSRQAHEPPQQEQQPRVRRTRSVLTLCDLAGSEPLANGSKERATVGPSDARSIHTSLQALGSVVTALTEGAAHVPFRASVLTKLLQRGLGGNSKCPHPQMPSNAHKPLKPLLQTRSSPSSYVVPDVSRLRGCHRVHLTGRARPDRNGTLATLRNAS